MLKIPITTPEYYVSSIVALNILSPDGTGDWHSADALSKNAFPEDFYIYGKNQKHDTFHLLGDIGVFDGTHRLQEMGYYPKNIPVWIADHPRACVDYLYTSVIQTGSIGEVILDEWFPSLEDKESVYKLIDIMEEKLTNEELENLKRWKEKNPLI